MYMHNVYIHTYVYICKDSVCYFTVLLYIATLRAKCAADLDQLLEFKVKQYAQGTVIPQCIVLCCNHRYTRNGGQI